jgi:hypothetical protein
VDDPRACARLIAERQGECDAEAEEDAHVTEAFDEQQRLLGYHDGDRIFIPTKLAAIWLANEYSTISAGRKLNRLIRETRVRRMEISGDTAKRGFYFWFDGAGSDTPARQDAWTRWGQILSDPPTPV